MISNLKNVLEFVGLQSCFCISVRFQNINKFLICHFSGVFVVLSHSDLKFEDLNNFVVLSFMLTNGRSDPPNGVQLIFFGSVHLFLTVLII